MAKIHGGQVLARALRAIGVDTAFTLTGGHVVAVLDGLVQEGIRVVDLRHEQAVVHAAEAYARLTGQLGLAVVTAGPGVTDSVTGVANALHSDTPLLVIGGRHFVRQELKGGLQEMDHPRLMSSVTKWAATAWQTDRLADYVSTAARHAFAGRGGPVFIDVPMEVQFDMVEESGITWPPPPDRGQIGGLEEKVLERALELMQNSARPVIFASAVGPGPNRLHDLAEAWQAPAFLSGRARGSIPSGHPLLGVHTRSRTMADADLVLALGVDWDFRAGYGEHLAPEAVVIQVDRDQAKIGWNRPATLGMVADPSRVVEQLTGQAGRLRPGRERTWADNFSAAESATAAALRTEAMAAADSPVDPTRFSIEVGEFFGKESIVAVDGGDIVSTAARWIQVSSPGHLLDPGPFGTLGT
ncbi:MAG TPA: thiamine pyrophosphate-binding protein, partial [Acidimicrobiia bacterium]